jgi:hypothetical protein
VALAVVNVTFGTNGFHKDSLLKVSSRRMALCGAAGRPFFMNRCLFKLIINK